MSDIFDAAVADRIKPTTIKAVPEWDKLVSLKKAMASIDFGCRFDNTNCACGVPGCCIEPTTDVLYWFKTIATDELFWISKEYDDKTTYSCGFWDKNAGCKLAWEYRPVNCIAFICDTAAAGLDPEYRAGLKALFAVMRDWETTIQVAEVSP